MNLLFSKTKNYEVTISQEEIRNRLNGTSNSDFLFATSKADGSFLLKLTSPLVIVDKGGIAFLSTLKGNLITDGNRTIIRTTVSPSSFLLIILYAIIALLIIQMIGLSVFSDSSNLEAYTVLTLFFVVFYFAIASSCRQLQNRFEKLFNLKPVA